jgi:hypothetical protein|tara:strand:- start:3605 stop:4828 length:1224 start_codon:yes stop_codon:yes gene_type:complete
MPISPTGGPTNNSGNFPNNTSTSITAVRVKFVLLNGNDYPITWEKYGKYSGMGGILFEEINNPGNDNLESLTFAKPLHTNIKSLPVVNEIVYIISLPGPNAQRNPSSGEELYYFQTVNIWNSVHHNALPNSIANDPSNAQKYSSTEAGVEIQSDVQGNKIQLGLTFKERNNIRNLQPFEGDILLEGRWGNTMRLGSTVSNSTPSNMWSNSGVNGEPIIILKNGQTNSEADPWIPQVEDINSDMSSIYLTSNQQIPIEGASVDYNSYTSPPENPNIFTGEQVLINSGRLYFNAKKDSILLSANTSINLNTQDTVNIDSKNSFTVDTREIYLGSKNATEPVILGNKFLDDFKKLLTEIVSLTAVLPTVGTQIPYTPNLAVAQSSTKVGYQAQTMLTSLSFYKSKTTKTT